jgi:hypothetical protein
VRNAYASQSDRSIATSADAAIRAKPLSNRCVEEAQGVFELITQVLVFMRIRKEDFKRHYMIKVLSMSEGTEHWPQAFAER